MAIKLYSTFITTINIDAVSFLHLLILVIINGESNKSVARFNFFKLFLRQRAWSVEILPSHQETDLLLAVSLIPPVILPVPFTAPVSS